MGTVTYHKQPGIHRTRGSVDLAGTSYVYTVGGHLWPEEVELFLSEQFVGSVLHVCCGKSMLGDIRGDLFEENVDVRLDAARLPLASGSFDTVLIDPPYNSKFQWNHDMLNELPRVARERIIFQHWYIPANKDGLFKKAHVYQLINLMAVPSLDNHIDELKVCLYDRETDTFYVAEEHTEGQTFYLRQAYAWQPRAYFGRTQLISVFERGEE